MVEAAERSGTSEAWLLALRETATEDLQPPPLPLPHGWLGERELQGSFGPTFARQILAAEAGEWVGPLDRDGGVHLVRVVATRAANAPPLDDVRRVLVSLWRRERGDRAVRAFLNAARRDTLIRTQEPARP